MARAVLLVQMASVVKMVFLDHRVLLVRKEIVEKTVGLVNLD